MPSNVDIFYDSSDGQACGRCDDPGSAYCTATGLPHAKPEEAPKEFKKVVRWVKTSKHLQSEGTLKEFLHSLADLWNMPRSNVKFVASSPVVLFVASPNYQMQCAGSYELQLDPHASTNAPELLNEHPVWRQVLTQDELDSGMVTKYIFMSPKNRWAVGELPGQGPYLICAANDGLPVPIEVDSWACNEPAKWVTDPQISFVAAGITQNKGMFLKLHTIERTKSHLMQILGEAEETPEELPSLVPKDAAQQETALHLGQQVFVRDEHSEPWRRGEVIGIRRGKVLVQPEGDAIKWCGEYDWKDVQPLKPKSANIRVGSEYLTKDSKGEYFMVRLVKANDDGQTCTCLVDDGTAEGVVWEDVYITNLLERDCLQADLKRWRRLTMDQRKAPKKLLNFVYSIGDTVEVRDNDDDPWLEGRVVGYDEKQVVKATIKLESSMPWAKPLYQPMVLVNKWAELDRPYRWNQVRKTKDPEVLEPIPGTKRAIIVSVSYNRQQGELQGVAAASRRLARSLKDSGFSGDVRTLSDESEQAMPTRGRIEAAIKWLVKDAEYGESLFFAFIGRAYTATDDSEGTEAALLPLDHNRAGFLTDDFLMHALLARIPEGVKITCLFDTNPPSAVWELSHRAFVGNNGSLRFSPSAQPFLKCTVTTISMLQSLNDMGENHCGRLTEAFCEFLAGNQEPSIPSLLITLGIELEGVGSPQLYTNSVADGELPRKQFYLGAYPRWEDEVHEELVFHTIELSRCGEPGVDGVYHLVQPRNKAKSPYYVGQDDKSFQIRYQSGVWWIVRDLGSSCTTLYQSTVSWPYPPVDSSYWQLVSGRPPEPKVELVHGGAKTAANSAALEVDITARLTEPVAKGKKKWLRGEHITAVKTGNTYAVRMQDGTWVYRVHPKKIKVVKEGDDIRVGDIVAARDTENEDWLIGRVVQLGKDKEAYVRPESQMAVKWDNPGGYLFKKIERVKLGVRFEGKDNFGKWWPITIIGENEDGTFQARVEATGGVWEMVYPSNIRRLKHMSAVNIALKKEIESWDGKEPDYSPPKTDVQAKDKVMVRDTVTEEWLAGSVEEIDDKGYPLVKPDGWSRGPFRWRFVQLGEQKKEEEEQPRTGPWPDRVPHAVVLNTPPHTRMCSYRKVHCIRFTPLGTKHSDSSNVAVGCLQLMLAPDKDFPNPVLVNSVEYTGGRRKDKYEHTADEATVISHDYWMCPMPASIVFTLDEPACVFGYRVQAATCDGAHDPEGWKIEVADARGGGWVLWDKQEVGCIPAERLGWTPTIRPGAWYAEHQGYTEKCQSTKCRILRSLAGVYTLKGGKADAMHGNPVYERSGACIYLAPNNSWMVATSPTDRDMGSGFIRAIDSSVPCYVTPGWQLYVVSSKQQLWQYDPDITIAAQATLTPVQK